METDVINVYKIENHLIITGTGTKYIKNEIKNTYNGKWQGQPYNMWLIPNTKKKTFLNDKNITNKVRIITGKPKNQNTLSTKKTTKKTSKKTSNY